MKKPKIFDSTLFYIIIGIILAFGINQGMALALSTDMPVVAVESDSMIPTFYKGDMLLLKGVPPEELKVGDIIVFSPNIQKTVNPETGKITYSLGGTPVVHRIIEINPDGTFQTKGDANHNQLDFEKRIEPAQIHGKEIMIIPHLGWVKIGITEYIIPNALWILLAVVVLYIGIIWIPKHIKAQKQINFQSVLIVGCLE